MSKRNSVITPSPRDGSLSAGATQGKLPLAENFFAPVKLSAEKAQQYEAIIKQTVIETLQEMAEHEVNGDGLQYNSPWKLVGQTESLVGYRRPDPERRHISLFRSFGRVKATPLTVMNYFHSDSSASFRKVNQLWHHDVLDARVIHTIRSGTPQNPHAYLGIKWVAFQPISSAHRRDNCFLEYMGYAKDIKGRRVGFRATLPIRIPECPELDSMRLPRVRMRDVLLVRECTGQPGMAQVYISGSYDLQDSASAESGFFKRYIENMKNMSELCDSKEISTELAVNPNKWVPDSLRKSCNVCARSFHATRLRHHCRLCGEVICRKCFVVRATPDEESKRKKIKVCVGCVTRLRRRSGSIQSPRHAPCGENKCRGQELNTTELGSLSSRLSVWSEVESLDRESLLSSFGAADGKFMPISEEITMNNLATPVLEHSERPSELSLDDCMCIDTKDMQPVPKVSASFSAASSVPYATPFATSSFSYGETQRDDRLGRSAPRSMHQEALDSIGQSLAEQQELLRQMAMASSRYRNKQRA